MVNFSGNNDLGYKARGRGIYPWPRLHHQGLEIMSEEKKVLPVSCKRLDCQVRWVTAWSFSNDDGGGSENVSLKWIRFFFSNFFAFLFNSLTMSMYVSFPAVNFLRTIPIVQKREKTTCRKSKFHVLVVR